MGFFDFLRGPDMAAGIEQLKNTPGGVLVDVRTPEEYRSGRIPGSVNVPLQTLDRISEQVGHKDVPLFVYCQSGARSRQAAAMLKSMGYTNVTNLGGMTAWRGKVER